MFLKAHDRGTAAAAAVAIQQLADTFGCADRFIGDPDTVYDAVVIEFNQEEGKRE